MSDYKLITWAGVRHQLRLYYRNGQTEAWLLLDKDGGTQPLIAYCDGDVVAATLAAWKKGEAWVTIIKVDKLAEGGTYVEMCVIEIASGCWQWNKDHFNDSPNDSFTFLRGVSAANLRAGVVAG